MYDYAFPTLGELAKALFDYSGLLARMNADDGLPLEEKDKKKIQTQIRRLAKEESNLEKNLNEVLSLFLEILSRYFNDPKVPIVIGATLSDIYCQYANLVSTEATCIPKKEVIRWLLQSRLPDRVITSYQKNILKFNAKHLAEHLPNQKHWWLPSFTKEGTVWPLKSVFNWTYSLYHQTATRFHNPEHGRAENYTLEQNLQNAHRWKSGACLPSWGSLVQNLKDALNEKNTSSTADDKLASLKLPFFIALLSTAIFQDIEKHYGKDFVIQLVTHIKKQDNRLEKQHLICEKILLRKLTAHSLIHYRSINKEFIDRAFYDGTNIFWDSYTRTLDHYALQIENIGIENLSFKDIKLLISRVGSFSIAGYLKEQQFNVSSWYSQDFARLLFKGLKLKNSKCSSEQIEEYKQELCDYNLVERLDWLLSWINAAYHYRNDDHKNAYGHFKNAFYSAKYTAGEHQYKLVNQYIESCAKNSNKREFKKGIAWADYLGIKVRWYRGFEELKTQEEKINATYKIMKLANYPIL